MIAYYWMGTSSSFPGVKAARAQNWPINPIQFQGSEYMDITSVPSVHHDNVFRHREMFKAPPWFGLS
jgi:hypothetical protein